MKMLSYEISKDSELYKLTPEEIEIVEGLKNKQFI
jgi:hypothetical protein